MPQHVKKPDALALLRQGKTPREVAEKLRLSLSTVKTWASNIGVRHRIPLTVEQKAEIVAAYIGGMDTAQVAAKYSLSAQAVRQFVKQAGYCVRQNLNNKHYRGLARAEWAERHRKR